MLATVPSGHEGPAGPAPPPGRPGAPVEVRRLSTALGRAKRKLLLVAIVAAALGAVLGKLIPKTYAASATVLWEPPAAARTDPVRELSTLAQSVKLPANLREVRDRTGSSKTMEALTKAIEVSQGENSMLLTIAARANSAEAAAELAQATVDVFLDSQRERARERLRETVTALRASLSQAETAHVLSRDDYDAFRAEHRVDDFPTEILAAIQELARLRVALNDARVELRGIEARRESLRHSHARNPESVVLSRNEQNNDEARAGQLETELAEARARYAADHPRVQVLEAELGSVRARARRAAPTVSGQTIGRNTVRDSLTAQIEESNALRSAIAERTRTLEALRGEAEARAAKLTSVQGEAAKLLADVKVNEEHVALLLKQLAMAEDDVRGATSGFQIVSAATTPERSEKGIGRVIAAATPLAALLVAALWVISRELSGLRIRCGSEAAFYAGAPVIWSTSWPSAGADPGETAMLERAISDACEDRPGVLGVTSLSDGIAARELGTLLVERLKKRGKRGAIVDATTPRVPAGASPGDVLEGPAFGARLAALTRKSPHVIVLLPPATDLPTLRAAVRWLDGTLVVARSGAHSPRALREVTEAAAVRGRGVALAVVRVPPELLSSAHRGVGEPALLFREAPITRAAKPPRSRRTARPEPAAPTPTIGEAGAAAPARVKRGAEGEPRPARARVRRMQKPDV